MAGSRDENFTGHGVYEVQLDSWAAIYDYLHDELLKHRTFVFRGHRSAKWTLEPALDRLERETGRHLRRIHLDRFKKAAAGLRGPNPPRLVNENQWWALAQHHGLATPLLDWTSSLFVAAYFAFIEDVPDDRDWTPNRIVFALAQRSIREKNAEHAKAHPEAQKDNTVDFLHTLSDENRRLLSQGGLFTKQPRGIDIERWIRGSFNARHDNYVLVRIAIPDRDREVCLRALNHMNINHLTLFPDLTGASYYCNLSYRLQSYHPVIRLSESDP